MMGRRTFLSTTGFVAAAGLTGCGPSQAAPKPRAVKDGFLLPAEGAPHEVTWMAYGATPGVWGEEPETAYGRDLTNARIVARQDLVRLAATISRFEPVALLVNNAADEAEANQFLTEIIEASSAKDQVGPELDGSGRIYLGDVAKSELPPIKTHPLDLVRVPLNDLWVRDTGPVFVTDASGALHGVNLNFNGWGQAPITTGLEGWRKDPRKAANGVVDQPIDEDRAVAAAIAADSAVPVVKTWLTMEGGGIEVNGHGLGVATESCLLNPNRNPGKQKEEIEVELRRLFGIERMLWMPGRPGLEVTDWHVDFLARFTAPGHLLYASAEFGEAEDKRDRKALLKAVDEINALPDDQRTRLLGGQKKLTTATLPEPDPAAVYKTYKARNQARPFTERSSDEFGQTAAPGYIGYYEANDCIVLGQYGDNATDAEAFDTVAEAFPDKIVVQISTDGLCTGGGTIHCATQQQPRKG
ncbi:agmatine deiminase family protein [Kribbella albertanoniae]|uniref:Agmatine deiminase family protein n=1 Tax=Kribbella albertanoniae TaxID=1266829 RepID=A0A4R4QB95_9ACTN|nr:agmatine deiminase family protein [Kribbella albertanoniae]TDC32701.1 agmatine deiminase family protein [Kribbella albertanoniae]